MTQFTYLFKFFPLPVTLFLLSFFMPCHNSSAGKESTCNAGDPNSIPGWGRAPREGIGYPLQYSWAFPGSSDVKKKKKKKIHLQLGRPGFHPCIGKIPWRKDGPPTSVFFTSLEAEVVKNLPAVQKT